MEKSYTYKFKRTHVLIADLTYMRNGVCIAGINLDNFKNIRSVLFSGHFQMDFIEKNNIYPCAIVTVEGMPKINVIPPHTEDFQIRDNPEFRRFVSQKEWLEILRQCSHHSLHDRLNNSIHENKWITPGTDVPSLSLIKLENRPLISSITIKRDTSTDIRASFISGDSAFNLKLNDIQLVDFIVNRYRIRTLDSPSYAGEQVLQEVNDELFPENQHYYLRIGLTRPYQEKCWLQINGIYSERSDMPIRKFTAE
ncbi:MAG: hypothetical protein HQK99_06330 [Nitrospirae bacterium]|nr:hypothetical protein [Nitrospirota bacterium]